MKKHKQIILGSIVIVALRVLNVYSDTVTFETAMPVYPEKSIGQVRDAVSFLREQQKIQVTLEEFSTPNDYMKRLQRLKKEFPNLLPKEVGKGEIQSGIQGVIEQCIHNWDNELCVKRAIPKAYKETTRCSGKEKCSVCSGFGSTSIYDSKIANVKCPLCSGTGKVLKATATGKPSSTPGSTGLVSVECSKCLGKGEVASAHRVANPKKCLDCGGTGKVDCVRSHARFLILVPNYRVGVNLVDRVWLSCVRKIGTWVAD